MFFQLVKTAFVAIVVFSLLCHETHQSESMSENKNETKTNANIFKAFLMQCPENNISRRNSIRVSVRIAVHSTAVKSNGSFVGKIFLGELFDSNRYFACDLEAPSLVDVSREDFVLMYPFKFETALKTVKESDTGIKSANSKDAQAYDNIDNTKADVHTANNVKLLDDIYYTRLKPSDFLKRSDDFMHTNPKDFRRDSICTKNFRNDNNKNNANNEYANEEFYGDKNQRENENAFSGKLGTNLNNNEIDNIMSNKRRTSDNEYSIGYLTKNLFDDKDSWKRREKAKKRKNDFIKCVGMKNFKKIDHLLCTCAGTVDEVYDVDEFENSDDEQSDCLQLINNVCLWGPLYNKNINYEMKMDEDIRNVNYGNIKSTAFACCDLLPPLYFALGKRCHNFLMNDDSVDDIDDKWIQITDGKVLDKLPEIMKKDSEDVMDETTSYLRSNVEQNEKIVENKIHRLHSPTYHLYSGNLARYKNKAMRNRLDTDRLINTKTVPFYDTVDAIIKIANNPMKLRNFHKKEAKPFDKDIYDPHLNIADKLQLINMINPKRPCERNRMNDHSSSNNRQKRYSDLTELTDDDLDSALENYEDSDLKSDGGLNSRGRDVKNYSTVKNSSTNNHESVKKVQKICSQHPCALAIPYRKDPYNRGEIKFLDNNGSTLNSNQIAENICQDHFNEFILIPFDYANGEM